MQQITTKTITHNLIFPMTAEDEEIYVEGKELTKKKWTKDEYYRLGI